MNSGSHEISTQLIQAARHLAARGWLPATDGNLSARIGVDRVLLTVSGIEKSDLAPSDLVELDVKNSDPGRGSSEWLVHRVIYSHCPNVNAILHVHSPFLTAFAASRRLPNSAILAEASLAIGKIALVSYETPGTPALADALVRAGITASVFLLENHGAVAVGASIRDAQHRLERAEFLAEVEWRSEFLGGARVLDASQIARLAESNRNSSNAGDSVC